MGVTAGRRVQCSTRAACQPSRQNAEYLNNDADASHIFQEFPSKIDKILIKSIKILSSEN